MRQFPAHSIPAKIYTMITGLFSRIQMTMLLIVLTLGLTSTYSFLYAEFSTTAYQGRWYEVARFENPFQQKCAKNVQAHYRLLHNEKIEVINTCENKNGTMDSVKGVARAQSQQDPSKLEVSFFSVFGWRPIWGDYWVIYWDSSYAWSVVGDKKSRYGWLLSRTPTLDEATVNRAKSIFAHHGYDSKKLIMTTQDSENKTQKDTP